MCYCPVGKVMDGWTDGKMGSDAYDSIVRYAQVGSKWKGPKVISAELCDNPNYTLTDLR